MSTDANRTVVRLIDEGTFNVVPTNPAFQTVRSTAPQGTFTPVTKTSAELVADRNYIDLIRVGISAGFSLGMEASYKALDPIIRPSMMSDWIRWPVRDNSATAASAISSVSATAYTVVTGAGTELNDVAFQAAMLVWATGFTNSGNNGLKLLTGGSMTVATVSGGTTEASPPAYARLKAVGIQGASGDITAGTTSIGTTVLNFSTLGFLPGMWVYVGGTAAGNKFATAANKDWVRISAVSATTLTLDIVPSGWTTDAGTGKTIQLFVGDVIRNGTTPRSTSIEVEYSDLEPEWDVYSGNRWGFEFSAAPQDILKFTGTAMGCNATNSTTRASGATTLPAPTNSVMNTSSHIGELRVNNVQLGSGPNFVTAISLKLDNTLRAQKGIGSLYNVGIGIGRANVTGSLSYYYGDNTVRSLLLAGTGLSYSSVFYDPSLQAAYHVDVPNMKLVSGTPTVSGVDTDRMLVTPWQGLKHSALGYALQMSRYDYLPL